MKRHLSTSVTVLLLAASAPSVLAAPVASEQVVAEPMQDETKDSSPNATADEMDAALAMVGDLFEAEPLTAKQEARLPAASAVVRTMIPEGFYAEMMGDVVDTMMTPMMGLMSGELAASGVISTRLAMDDDVRSDLSAEQTLELARILDPAFDRRGEAMQTMLQSLMTESAAVIEPVFRDGMSRAYAVRFDEAQLNDIAAFFATPTGALFATENMKLMADPQVMSASMQALPAMMSQFADMEAQVTEAFAELPAEKTYADLTPAERDRVSALTGIASSDLERAILPPRDDPFGSDADLYDADDEGSGDDGWDDSAFDDVMVDKGEK